MMTAPGTVIIRGAGMRLWTEWRDHSEMVLVGAADTAKTVSIALWHDYMCRTYQGIRMLVFRKTRVSLTQAWMQTFRKVLLNPEFYLLDEYGENPPDDVFTETAAYLASRNAHLFRGPTDAHRTEFRYRNGSTIVLCGMNEPTRLFSSEYDTGYCNEMNELTLGEWESIRRALRGTVLQRYGILNNPQLGDCNPDHPGHWILKRIQAGRLVKFDASHLDNPWITETRHGRMKLEEMDRLLTGVRRRRLFLNEWAGSERMIYLDWDPAVHTFDGELYRDESGSWWLDITDPKPRKVKLLRFVGGQDWGHENPGCQQVWGLDAKGRMYLVREHYMTKRRINWWAEVAAENYAKFRVHPIVCDHDPGNIESFNDRLGVSKTKIDEERTGVPRIAIEADKEVQAGIDHVRDRLALDEEGFPRLMVWRKALAHEPDPELTGANVLASLERPACTQDEFPQYQNREVEDDAEDTRRDDPLKKNDHGMDPTRYVAMWCWRVIPSERERVEPYAQGTYGAMFKSHRRRRA